MNLSYTRKSNSHLRKNESAIKIQKYFRGYMSRRIYWSFLKTLDFYNEEIVTNLRVMVPDYECKRNKSSLSFTDIVHNKPLFNNINDFCCDESDVSDIIEISNEFKSFVENFSQSDVIAKDCESACKSQEPLISNDLIESSSASTFSAEDLESDSAVSRNRNIDPPNNTTFSINKFHSYDIESLQKEILWLEKAIRDRIRK